MEFILSAADRNLRESAGRFVRDILPRFSESPAFPLRAWTRGLGKALRDAGFTGLRIPSIYGGRERTALQAAVILEEIARTSPPLAFFLANHNGFCAEHILRHGTEEQARRFLPRLASGECPGCWRPPKAGHGPDGGVKVKALFDSGRWTLRGGPLFELGIKGEIAVVSAEISNGDPENAAKVFLAEYAGGFVGATAEILGAGEGAGMETMSTVGALGKVYTAACRLGTAAGLLLRVLDAAHPEPVSGPPQSGFDSEWGAATVDVLMELDAVRLRIYRACLLDDAGRAGKGEEAILADRSAEMAAEKANRVAARRVGRGDLFAAARRGGIASDEHG